MKWQIVYPNLDHPVSEIEAAWLEINSRGDLVFYRDDHEIKFSVASGCWGSVKRMGEDEK